MCGLSRAATRHSVQKHSLQFLLRVPRQHCRPHYVRLRGDLYPPWRRGELAQWRVSVGMWPYNGFRWGSPCRVSERHRFSLVSGLWRRRHLAPDPPGWSSEIEDGQPHPWVQTGFRLCEYQASGQRIRIQETTEHQPRGQRDGAERWGGCLIDWGMAGERLMIGRWRISLTPQCFLAHGRHHCESPV